MRFSFKADLSLQRIVAIATLTTLACTGLGPEVSKPRNVVADDDRNAQLLALMSHVPRTIIPCGKVHGIVVDEESVSVVGNVHVQLVSTAGRVSATSSSNGSFELQPRDTAEVVIRVTRGKSIVMEMPLTNRFRNSAGFFMTVVLGDRGRVYVEEGWCPSANSAGRPQPAPPDATLPPQR